MKAILAAGLKAGHTEVWWAEGTLPLEEFKDVLDSPQRALLIEHLQITSLYDCNIGLGGENLTVVIRWCPQLLKSSFRCARCTRGRCGCPRSCAWPNSPLVVYSTRNQRGNSPLIRTPPTTHIFLPSTTRKYIRVEKMLKS